MVRRPPDQSQRRVRCGCASERTKRWKLAEIKSRGDIAVTNGMKPQSLLTLSAVVATLTTPNVVGKAFDHGIFHETRRCEEKFPFLGKNFREPRNSMDSAP